MPRLISLSSVVFVVLVCSSGYGTRVQPVEETGVITINADGSETETESFSISPENLAKNGVVEEHKTLQVKDNQHPNAKPKTVHVTKPMDPDLVKATGIRMKQDVTAMKKLEKREAKSSSTQHKEIEEDLKAVDKAIIMQKENIAADEKERLFQKSVQNKLLQQAIALKAESLKEQGLLGKPLSTWFGAHSADGKEAKRGWFAYDGPGKRKGQRTSAHHNGFFGPNDESKALEVFGPEMRHHAADSKLSFAQEGHFLHDMSGNHNGTSNTRMGHQKGMDLLVGKETKGQGEHMLATKAATLSVAGVASSDYHSPVGRIVLIVLLVVVVIFTGVVGIGLLVHQRLYPKTKKGRAAEEAEDEETDPLTNPGSDSDELV